MQQMLCREGIIEVQINKVNSGTSILIVDCGKAYNPMFKNIFEPGYTTKDRGWGLDYPCKTNCRRTSQGES